MTTSSASGVKSNPGEPFQATRIATVVRKLPLQHIEPGGHKAFKELYKAQPLLFASDVEVLIRAFGEHLRTSIVYRDLAEKVNGYMKEKYITAIGQIKEQVIRISNTYLELEGQTEICRSFLNSLVAIPETAVIKIPDFLGPGTALPPSIPTGANPVPLQVLDKLPSAALFTNHLLQGDPWMPHDTTYQESEDEIDSDLTDFQETDRTESDTDTVDLTTDDYTDEESCESFLDLLDQPFPYHTDIWSFPREDIEGFLYETLTREEALQEATELIETEKLSQWRSPVRKARSQENRTIYMSKRHSPY